MSEFIRPAPGRIDPKDDPVITPPGPIICGIDCSPAAIADRLRRLGELEALYYNGVSQLTDRNRSVTFASRADLVAAMNALRAQIYVCATGAWPGRPPRLYYVQQVKDL